MRAMRQSMSEVFDDAPGATHGKTVQSAINWSGGLISLVLIAGTAVWGYKLLVRDVTGVPVVRALEGPMRVAPDDPGGSMAAHQGLAVNRVAAAGTAAGPVESVILAPAPLNLSAEDVPMPRLPHPVLDQAVPRDVAQADDAGTVEDTPEDALATDMAVAEALTDTETVLPEMTGDPSADALALAEALSEGVVPLSGTDEPAEELAAASPLRDEAGLARSPRPHVRPDNLATTLPTPTAVETVSAETAEIAADNIAPGTRLVQLGAFESAEIARAQWDKIGGQFEEYFDGKSRVVQRAQSNGKTFYRLRALGFADLGDARRFCSALMAQKADCIPVLVR